MHWTMKGDDDKLNWEIFYHQLYISDKEVLRIIKIRVILKHFSCLYSPIPSCFFFFKW